MRSKTFIFLTFLFFACLAMVGWYLAEGYRSKAPVAMARGAEPFIEENIDTTQKYQDFFSWAKLKGESILGYIRGKISTQP